MNFAFLQLYWWVWWEKMWKLGRSFPGNVGVWWEILELGGKFCLFVHERKHVRNCGENWPASWEINIFSSPADKNLCKNRLLDSYLISCNQTNIHHILCLMLVTKYKLFAAQDHCFQSYIEACFPGSSQVSSLSPPIESSIMWLCSHTTQPALYSVDVPDTIHLN